ncbi:hypothetical protein CBL_07271 [Carabus blaptoides fortunei]
MKSVDGNYAFSFDRNLHKHSSYVSASINSSSSYILGDMYIHHPPLRATIYALVGVQVVVDKRTVQQKQPVTAVILCITARRSTITGEPIKELRERLFSNVHWF